MADHEALDMAVAERFIWQVIGLNVMDAHLEYRKSTSQTSPGSLDEIYLDVIHARQYFDTLAILPC